MDGRLARVWYLPEGWNKVSAARPVEEYSENPALFQIATSWPDNRNDNWEQIKKTCPCIYLVRSPLTFGHSQLIIPSAGDCEQDLFRLASEIIYDVISVFTKSFGDKEKKPLHEDEAFKPLAENTHTYGLYKKTLVLRASAQENSSEEYKVHLVPYFESHELLCKKRFQSLHIVRPEETGGLLAWLGERENDADRWEVDSSPVKPQLDQIANENLRMIDLAKKLRKLWQRIRKRSNKPNAGDSL